jgi:hypothetical protein
MNEGTDCDPIVRWVLDDLLFDIRPDERRSPWCVDLKLQRPSTGEDRVLQLNAMFPDLAVQAPPDRLSDTGTVERPLLITHNQGIGDYVQQLRYLKAPQLALRRILLECSAALHDLVEAQGLNVELVEPGIRRGDPAVDEASLMRLGHWLKNPTGVRPYIKTPRKRRHGRGGRRRVGLNWSGRSGTIAAGTKSIELSDLEPLVAPRPDIDWVSVQWGPAEHELQRHSWTTSIEPRGRTINTVGRLASEIAELDLLITIDSAPAHLAGALGVPVWTILGRAWSWRWRLKRTSSHLYGSMRLIRRNEHDGGTGLADRVGRALDSGAEWTVAAMEGTASDDGSNACTSVASQFVDDPIGMLRSRGVRIRPYDSDALACIFQLLVRCYGGFSWSVPEPMPAPPIRARGGLIGHPVFADLVSAATAR